MKDKEIRIDVLCQKDEGLEKSEAKEANRNHFEGLHLLF